LDITSGGELVQVCSERLPTLTGRYIIHKIIAVGQNRTDLTYFALVRVRIDAGEIVVVWTDPDDLKSRLAEGDASQHEPNDS
jgi:hypothetical protein